MAHDPVCKLEVDPLNASAQTTYKGKTYYFCSARCRGFFDQHPERYVKKKQQKKEGFAKRLLKR